MSDFQAYAIEETQRGTGILLMIEDGHVAIVSGPSKTIELLARDLPPESSLRLRSFRKEGYTAWETVFEGEKGSVLQGKTAMDLHERHRRKA